MQVVRASMIMAVFMGMAVSMRVTFMSMAVTM